MKSILDYDLIFDSNVEKFLKKLARKDKQGVQVLLDTIREIPKDPYNSKSLKGLLKGNR